MNTSLVSRTSAGIVLALLALPVAAHDGHLHDGVLAGLAHPLGGVDHLLATVGLGLVAGLAARGSAAGGRSALVRAGTASLLGVVAGALVWGLGGGGPGMAIAGGLAETAVLFGLLALAVALVSVERLGPAGLGVFATLVALPHGWLHAAEGVGAPFLLGLALASVVLFGAGAAAGRRLARVDVRRAGAARWTLAATYVAGFTGLVVAGAR
jgi:urease accessory protein